MNILPRLAHCNAGCADQASSASSKPMRASMAFLCSFLQAGTSRVTASESQRPAINLSHRLLSVAGALSLLVLAAVLVATLFSDDYGRAVQMQASGSSALSDKLAGAAPLSDVRTIADRTDDAIKHSRTGL